jgi:hypothetical protein
MVVDVIPTSGPSAGDIRAELARHRLRIYKVAARAAMHPSLLSRIIQEHAPLAPHIATRIWAAIMEEARSSNGATR